MWTGQTICHPRMTDDDFKLAAEAGLYHFSVGVESGSERIRREMGKYFTDEELYRFLTYASNHGIRVRISLIVGWFTESEEDFQETLDLVTEVAKRGIISKISPGGTLSLGGWKCIPEYVPMYKKYNDLLTYDKYSNWIYKNNTMKVRLDRWFRLRKHIVDVGLEPHLQRVVKMERQYRFYNDGDPPE